MMVEISFPFFEMLLTGELDFEEYKKQVSNLPKDTKIVRAADTNQFMPDRYMTIISFIIESETFEELPLGTRIPHFNLEFVKKE